MNNITTMKLYRHTIHLFMTLPKTIYTYGKNGLALPTISRCDPMKMSEHHKNLEKHNTVQWVSIARS